MCTVCFYICVDYFFCAILKYCVMTNVQYLICLMAYHFCFRVLKVASYPLNKHKNEFKNNQ